MDLLAVGEAVAVGVGDLRVGAEGELLEVGESVVVEESVVGALAGVGGDGLVEPVGVLVEVGHGVVVGVGGIDATPIETPEPQFQSRATSAEVRGRSQMPTSSMMPSEKVAGLPGAGPDGQGGVGVPELRAAAGGGNELAVEVEADADAGFHHPDNVVDERRRRAMGDVGAVAGGGGAAEAAEHRGGGGELVGAAPLQAPALAGALADEGAARAEK